MNNAFAPAAKKPLVVIMHVQTTRMDRNFYKPLEEKGGRIFEPYDKMCIMAEEARKAGVPVKFVEIKGLAATEPVLLEKAGGSAERVIYWNYDASLRIFQLLEDGQKLAQGERHSVILAGNDKYYCVYVTAYGLVQRGVEVITSNDLLIWKAKGNDSHHFEKDWFFLKETRFLTLPEILPMIRTKR